MPPSVCRSISRSGATLTKAMLVCSGRFIGAATARTRISRILSVSILIFPASASRELRLALLHEGLAPLFVVGALRAALDGRAHARLVRAALRFHVLLDDRLGIRDRERRVLG